MTNPEINGVFKYGVREMVGNHFHLERIEDHSERVKALASLNQLRESSYKLYPGEGLKDALDRTIYVIKRISNKEDGTALPLIVTLAQYAIGLSGSVFTNPVLEQPLREALTVTAGNSARHTLYSAEANRESARIQNYDSDRLDTGGFNRISPERRERANEFVQLSRIPFAMSSSK